MCVCVCVFIDVCVCACTDTTIPSYFMAFHIFTGVKALPLFPPRDRGDVTLWGQRGGEGRGGDDVTVSPDPQACNLPKDAYRKAARWRNPTPRERPARASSRGHAFGRLGDIRADLFEFPSLRSLFVFWVSVRFIPAPFGLFHIVMGLHSGECVCASSLFCCQGLRWMEGAAGSSGGEAREARAFQLF